MGSGNQLEISRLGQNSVCVWMVWSDVVGQDLDCNLDCDLDCHLDCDLDCDLDCGLNCWHHGAGYHDGVLAMTATCMARAHYHA